MTNTAYVFPGQGSQTIGMLHELAQRYPIVVETFNETSAYVGYNIWELAQQGPESKLNQTEHTQVAMLSADVAVYRVIQQCGGAAASMMAGHSLGEYAALVCSNAMMLGDAAKLVAKRGQLMQETVPLGQGAMAAIVGLTDEQVQTLCRDSSTKTRQVSPANYNAIGQVVIAGHTSAVNHAISLADTMGARMALAIPVSVPCHCPLLAKAAELYIGYLEQINFKVPAIPVISNVDLSSYTSAAQISMLLAEQLYRPVRWVETIQLMKNKGIEHIVECGPGKVLGGLVKRIDKTIRTSSVNDPSSLELYLAQN